MGRLDQYVGAGPPRQTQRSWTARPGRVRLQGPRDQDDAIGHIEPTRQAIETFVHRDIDGPVTMLNLLRFRGQADYSRSPELAPDETISGREAYRRYEENTLPLLQATGGKVVVYADAGHPLIGPPDERWDLVLLVRYPSPGAFLSFTSDEDYLAGVGHRTAALEDSRLLPTVEHSLG